MTPPASPSPVLQPVVRRLDQVAARLRLLTTLRGLARVLAWTVAAVAGAYGLDRALDLPVEARLIALLALLGLLGRELLTRVARPLLAGPDRQDAARLVERGLPQLEGRVISALQVGDGPQGSLQHELVLQAARACTERDLREVLTPRPTAREAARALGLLAALAGLTWLAEPHLAVFAQRWSLQDVPWPRRTFLSLQIPARGPSHLVLEDGSVAVTRGGVLELSASARGTDPGRVEILVEGRERAQRATMTRIDGAYRGRITVDRDALALLVRGGDDPGEDTRRRLRVVEPPRLEALRFGLEPPAYTGQAPSEVGPEGLVVPEGTRVTAMGRPSEGARSARLRLSTAGRELPMIPDEQAGAGRWTGSFTAEASDSIVIQLTGEHDLAAPDPDHHALVVHRDRPPTLRVFRPVRSDLKVTARAVVPVAVAARDDHGVVSVRLLPETSAPLELQRDPTRPGQYRALLDLTGDGQAPGAYRVQVTDGRDLPGKGQQVAFQDGRRVDVVPDSEVLRLLGERQLRLKERFAALRDRQAQAAEDVAALAADVPTAGHPDLVAAAVGQQQVTTRLQREARELAGILEETILNRLDPGPGAEAVLQARLAAWSARPVDEGFAPEDWSALARDYAEGRFGRLDRTGRLLEMADLALELSVRLSPQAHALLQQARQEPDADALHAAREAQQGVVAGLVRLLERMDEWEDFQEVLSLVQRLVDDQKALRTRTRAALQGAD